MALTKCFNVYSSKTKITDKYLEKDLVKFIPASGAATRMFEHLYKYIETEEETELVKEFFANIEKFAFYEEIKDSVKDKNNLENRKEIINLILKDKLNYGFLPKALIKMHQYGDVSATPIDEHIYEGLHYLNKDNIRLHFTISNEHEKDFNEYVSNILKDKDNIEITYSFQKEKTDTLAVDLDNNPFKLKDRSYLYRPGGHGALIENLNDIHADIIFIKNIDNVTHQDRVKDTIDNKKKLASIGSTIKEQIDNYIKTLLNDSFNLKEIERFLKETLHINYKKELTKEIALAFLNRPLRVCGVVLNTGEPGGGPFIVDNGEYTDLQICEKSEVNFNDNLIVKAFNSSKYFNPVDLVCFVKDYENDKFNLLNYINEDRYFISKKSHEGTPIKALEHPGLWNGAMHNWNTVFVEVPLTTFNPVKTVNDLLREGHQSKK